MKKLLVTIIIASLLSCNNPLSKVYTEERFMLDLVEIRESNGQETAEKITTYVMQQVRKSAFDKGADNMLVGKTYEQLLGQAKVKEEEEKRLRKVLDGVGQIYEKISDANERMDESNNYIFDNIKVNAEEKGGKWIGFIRTAKEIKEKSDAFYSRISDIMNQITEKQREKDPDLKEYAQMDKGEALDVIFFKEGSDVAANEFLDIINTYKMRVIQIFGSQYPEYIETVEARFYTGDENGNIQNRDGLDEPWLNANFQDFPLVSSLAKFSMMQNDIRQTEYDVFATLMGKELKMSSTVNESNYISLLKTEKGAYYQGETFDGSIVLGRKGGAQYPNRVDLKMDGRLLTKKDYDLIAGGIKLKVSAGNPGDHEISGDLIFLNYNDGLEVKIPVKQSFAVISKCK